MSPTPQLTPDSGLSLLKITHIIYGLFALGILTFGVFGVSTIAAVVLAYVKRADAAGTMYAKHFDWVLGTFWWSVLWMVLSGIGTLLFVGWITAFVALVWLVYRIVRGWLALFDGRSPTSDL